MVKTKGNRNQNERKKKKGSCCNKDKTTEDGGHVPRAGDLAIHHSLFRSAKRPIATCAEHTLIGKKTSPKSRESRADTKQRYCKQAGEKSLPSPCSKKGGIKSGADRLQIQPAPGPIAPLLLRDLPPTTTIITIQKRNEKRNTLQKIALILGWTMIHGHGPSVLHIDKQ